MLEILDINTNKDNLSEIVELKDDFRSYLGQTVKEGIVIIVSNFPVIGNIQGSIDYLIFIVVKENKGYIKVRKNGINQNVDSLVICINKFDIEDLVDINSESLISSEGSFNYYDSINLNRYAIDTYAENILKIHSTMLYSIRCESFNKYSNHFILLNEDLSAKTLIENASLQYVSKYGTDYRINSLKKDFIKYSDNDKLINLINSLLERANSESKNGILTINKMNKIASSSAYLEPLTTNIGNKLSIISGKAGTGKTLLINRFIHKYMKENKNVRLLTYNNLLVFDFRQVFRNFPFYKPTNVAISTVHSFFHNLSEKLGIRLILNEERINELMGVCELRIDSIREPLQKYLKNNNHFKKDEFLKYLAYEPHNSSDNDEIIDFSQFIEIRGKYMEFSNLKNQYLARKKQILIGSDSNQTFLSDYPKYLELIYMAVTNSKEFYTKLNINERYELLATLYNTDKYIGDGPKEIPYENLLDRVKALKSNTNWSKVLIIDEGQDFSVYEKEILYHLRGSENMIVATGGREQIIRNSKLLDWSSSMSKKIPNQQFNISNKSYRQKQNIIKFVNMFSESFEININLDSVPESAGLGKVIIDTREKQNLCNPYIAKELLDLGKINGCSPYESVIFLIPSKRYTSKELSRGHVVNDIDYFYEVEITKNRKTMDKESLEDLGYICWDGVSENKNKLTIPNQLETRIIHYESCRGLEAWSVACMSLDEYFKFKHSTKEAEHHLSDDLFYEEEERRNQYAAMWCLMAFTRPIDTLYIHLHDTNNEISKIILDIGSKCPGVEIYKENA
jgi:Ni2+-binding GTPase involved in maturation of urease and hydrogenase